MALKPDPVSEALRKVLRSVAVKATEQAKPKKPRKTKRKSKGRTHILCKQHLRSKHYDYTSS